MKITNAKLTKEERNQIEEAIKNQADPKDSFEELSVLVQVALHVLGADECRPPDEKPTVEMLRGFVFHSEGPNEIRWTIDRILEDLGHAIDASRRRGSTIKERRRVAQDLFFALRRRVHIP